MDGWMDGAKGWVLTISPRTSLTNAGFPLHPRLQLPDSRRLACDRAWAGPVPAGKTGWGSLFLAYSALFLLTSPTTPQPHPQHTDFLSSEKVHFKRPAPTDY